MNESTKTGIFGAAALVALALALAASSSGRKVVEADDPLAKLFPDFTDAMAATSMKIVKFDEEQSQLHEFEVAKRDNVWVIPSHNDYPADAAKRLAEVATALIDIRRGPKFSDQKTSHGTFGVIEPSTNLEAGTKGVGQLVVLEREGGKRLAELVIGKEVKDRFGWHYVRVRDQDRVYQVKVESDKFSTKFEDWIERDVLKMKLRDRDDASKLPDQPLAVQRIVVEDYEARWEPDPRRTSAVQVSPNRDRLDLRYDDSATDKKWTLADLAEGKELVELKLNDLRDALRDLKIVDVHRKPQALSDIFSGKAKGGVSRDELRSLIVRGFYPDDQLYCSSGEVIVETKEGILYVLNFGNIADKTFEQKEAERRKAEERAVGEKKADDKADKAKSEAEKKEPEKKHPEKTDADKKDAAKDEKAAGKKDTDKKDTDKKDAKKEGEKAEGPVGSNRYLFVQAAFDKNLVQKPKLRQVFGEPHLPAKAAPEKEKGEKEKAGKEKPDKEKAAKKGPQEPTLADSVKELLRLDEERLVDKAEFEARRKEIEESNKFAQREYDDKIQAAEKRVKELNERFADWYYVIDDEVFKKIRIKRADITKAPEKAKDEKKEEKKDESAKEKSGDAETPKAP